MIDGEWVDDPSKVKDEFRDYFASRFCDPGIRHGVINFNFPNHLNIDQSGELEAPISRDEIRKAVWDCGENKSPGPDGFTFEFFRKFWNIPMGERERRAKTAVKQPSTTFPTYLLALSPYPFIISLLPGASPGRIYSVTIA
ncbi:hypothetical protein Tco_1106448 [Tanacetum coccineum]